MGCSNPLCPACYPIIDRETFDKYLERNNPKLRKELMMPKKVSEKFYVGSRSMIDGSRPGWAKKTIQEAIDHAVEMCERTEEEQIVVQIVRIVRPAKRPVTVEKVY